jgi:hypothetical protein
MVPQGLILEATRIELELRRLTLGPAFFTVSLYGSLVSMNVFVGMNPFHSSSVSSAAAVGVSTMLSLRFFKVRIYGLNTILRGFRVSL